MVQAADANHDGKLDIDEVDADRFFKILDRNGDGYIDDKEMTFYETRMVPQQIQQGTRRGDGDGRHPRSCVFHRRREHAHQAQRAHQ